MSDDRYSYLHARLDTVPHLADDFCFAVELPDEDVDVPSHLVPLYQDEEDDSVLPTNSHPSYPYGNPYRVTAASKLSTPFATAHRSLATTLPSLYLSQIGHTPAQQKWTDLGLDGVLPYEPPSEHVTAPSAIPDDPRTAPGHPQGAQHAGGRDDATEEGSGDENSAGSDAEMQDERNRPASETPEV